MRVLFVHPQACYLKRIVQFWENCSEHEQFPPIMVSHFQPLYCILTHAFYLLLLSLRPPEGQRGRRLHRGWGGGGKFAKWWSELGSWASPGGLTSESASWPCLYTHPGQVNITIAQLAGTDQNRRTIGVLVSQLFFHQSHLFAPTGMYFALIYSFLEAGHSFGGEVSRNHPQHAVYFSPEGGETCSLCPLPFFTLKGQRVLGGCDGTGRFWAHPIPPAGRWVCTDALVYKTRYLLCVSLGIILLDVVFTERLMFSICKGKNVMPRNTIYNLIGENVYLFN